MRESSDVGRVDRVTGGGEVVEGCLGVDGLPEHDDVDHHAERAELAFNPMDGPDDLRAALRELAADSDLADLPLETASVGPVGPARCWTITACDRTPRRWPS